MLTFATIINLVRFESPSFYLKVGEGIQRSWSHMFRCVSRWWFQIFYIFTSILGEMVQFDLSIFFKWVAKNHQLGFLRAEFSMAMFNYHYIRGFFWYAKVVQKKQIGGILGFGRLGWLDRPSLMCTMDRVLGVRMMFWCSKKTRHEAAPLLP